MRKRIIGLRNIINHEYYEIEYDKLYTIILKSLPILKTEVN
ncbi:MAG: HepT-like ribonuclease domain-containing protein [Chitinophagaceae bacterium]